jgi:hypothetical protein
MLILTMPLVAVRFRIEGWTMVMAGEISFKIAFLRTMTPVMTEPDLDKFINICKSFDEDRATMADLRLLDELYKKFDKPPGRT